MYAALKMSMGTWEYYSVKMKMSQVASEIRFASEVNDDKTLDTAIQREISQSRASTQIVNYLVKNDQRFFNSLVVAALGGNPSFSAVKLADDPRFEFFKDSFTDTFGVLQFDDSIKTYALDGQHRLFAIKSLLDHNNEATPPTGFGDETINVIFVVPSADATRDDFLKSYRRLFSSLNRHAKSTAANTNIIMDEGDRFAIVTRRLFAESDFFKWDGNEANPRIDTDTSSQAVARNSTAWATLVALYKMNITLLWDEQYQLEFGQYKTQHVLIQRTPLDEEVDDLFTYLDTIWDSLVETLPVLKEDPSKKRRSGADGSEEGVEDNLLFRPIGQTSILAPLARRLMNNAGITKGNTFQEINHALKPLKYLDWNLQSQIWRGLLSIEDPVKNTWSMRTTDSAKCLGVGMNILLWVCALENLNEDQVEELRLEWGTWLSPRLGHIREHEIFEDLMALREKIINECY